VISEKSRTRTYQFAGLQKVTLHHSPARRCANCGFRDPVIRYSESFRLAVVSAVIGKRARFIPREIRFLRKHLGWSGTEFSVYMGQTPETVSRWVNGRTPMGVTADRLLRLLVAMNTPGAEFPLQRFRVVASEPACATPIAVEFRDGQWHAIP
jgi:DNA-binding transcriptional regulator YiaG